MRFRIRSLLLLVAIVAVILGVFVHFRNERNDAWANLQADGVHFHKNGNDPVAEIWVSTIDGQTYEVNGERMAEQAARNKLRRISRDLDRLGITWIVALDDEPGPTPGTMQTRKSTLAFVYSSGFSQYNYVGQGAHSRSNP